ncbi:uncharacterized protein LOC111316374 [Durio zibethinus]|uniref:Uncharacterized protein LOC111316374 n=1 Tax=Durio zibethinus TaxID=66656 RepID=A0A6P6BAG0_DURZI|nr:uncharacterized protein LOC111316374 [Durio zibethinus]
MVDGREIIKQESKWDVNDIKMVQLNTKAMYTLFYALGPNKYNRVSLCENMKLDETISEILNYFTNIINGLKALGKTYSNVEIVKKILNSLPKSWEAKVTAIEGSKDPHTFSLDELMILFLPMR